MKLRDLLISIDHSLKQLVQILADQHRYISDTPPPQCPPSLNLDPSLLMVSERALGLPDGFFRKSLPNDLPWHKPDPKTYQTKPPSSPEQDFVRWQDEAKGLVTHLLAHSIPIVEAVFVAENPKDWRLHIGVVPGMLDRRALMYATLAFLNNTKASLPLQRCRFGEAALPYTSRFVDYDEAFVVLPFGFAVQAAPEGDEKDGI